LGKKIITLHITAKRVPPRGIKQYAGAGIHKQKGRQIRKGMKHDVFISYKRQSLNIVNAIAHVLEDGGIKYWYDSGLEEKAGKDYLDIIAENISESRIMIAVLSDEALESDWIKAEITTALDQKKLIIPFVVSELTISNGLTMRLSNKHRIDAYPNPDRKFAILVKNVKLALNELYSEDSDNPQKPQRFKVEEDFSIDFDFDEGEALYEAKEYNEAALAYLASAERGNKRAQDRLCQMFFDKQNEIYTFDDDVWSAVELQARHGHCYANFLMHCKLFKDADKSLVAFEYLKKAISKNSIPLAFLRMGIQYSWGMGIKQSHTLGSHYYKKALDMGCKESYSYIAQEYRFGNDKIKKDINKAIELLEKGIAAGDERSYNALCNIYLYDLKQKDKAKGIAQQAISSGCKKGYLLMGDVEYNDDPDAGIGWYKRALRHDVAGAYGMLAFIYDQRDEKDTALTMARKGMMLQDSLSYRFMGYHYTENNELDKAWQCYKECFDKFGTAADELATLVIKHGYTPPEIKTEEEKRIFLDQLEQIVEVQARNNNEECIKALLKIYSYKENGIYILDYDIWRRKAKAFEIIRLGAEFGYTEMMHHLGMALMDDQTPSRYNPPQGVMWLANAAEGGYGPSIEKLLSIYSTGIWEDSKEFIKIVLMAIEHKSVPKEKLLSYLRNVNLDEVSDNDKEKIRNFVESLILDNDDIDSKNDAVCYYLRNRDSLQEEPGKNILKEIRKYIDSLLVQKNYGCLLQCNRIILEQCYPEYNRIDGIRDYLNNKESLNAQIFYAFDSGCNTNYGHESKQHDNALGIVFDELRNDVSFAEFAEVGKPKRLGTEESWIVAFENFDDAYRALCTNHHVTQYGHTFPSYEESIPYVSSNKAIKAWHDVLHCMYTLYDHIPEVKDILDNSKTEQEILDIAEKVNDNTDLQLLLIEFVEIAINIDYAVEKNHATWQKLEAGEYEPVAERINLYIDLVNDACGSGVELEKYTAEKVRQLYKDGTKDEFDRLLDEFIVKELKTESVQ